MLIGITGGVGAGKSRVAALLGEILKATVISADDVCRELLEPGQPGYLKVVETWGKRYVTGAGALDRKLLRRETFEKPQVRRALEAILHPLVRASILAEKRSAEKHEIVIAEVPLLFECGWRDDFDLVICVYLDPETAVRRVAARDGVSLVDAQNIVNIQLSPDEKRKGADMVLDNSSGMIETEAQIRELAGTIKSRINIDTR